MEGLWESFRWFWGDLARILGRFEDWGLGFSAMRPLRFCMPRCLGFWGYALEIAAMKTRKGTFCPCCLPEATTTKCRVFRFRGCNFLLVVISLATACIQQSQENCSHENEKTLFCPCSPPSGYKWFSCFRGCNFLMAAISLCHLIWPGGMREAIKSAVIPFEGCPGVWNHQS